MTLAYEFPNQNFIYLIYYYGRGEEEVFAQRRQGSLELVSFENTSYGKATMRPNGV